jgi:transcriptional regulator with PAS, ATPase and Fis domain
LETLRPMLMSVLNRLDEVLAYWYERYLLHFGNDRSLTEAEFRSIFADALTRTTNHLLAGDMDSYSRAVMRTGELLAERRVPFSEVIASLHLYEESVFAVLPCPTDPLKAYGTFDKLSHIRMILLADAYFRSETAIAGARIHALEREAATISPEQRRGFHGLVGATPAMRRLYDRIEAAASTRGNVLIIGESGTGKELVARAIHECGTNPAAPFVALNCAAIPRELIESELFGYKRGAFSGAHTEYLGLFRAADGGTLFLDEVTEMGAETQSKLLRAIQEKKVRPVGATQETAVDVRLIASSNRNPVQAIAAAQLRPDLYYRLQASVMEIAPLRQRLDDLPLLIDHFIALFSEKLRPRTPIRGVTNEVLAAMRAYEWPGNVRELSNMIESAFTFGSGPLITLADLPAALAGLQTHRRTDSEHTRAVSTFAEAERELITRALETTGGNKLAAARLLRISRKKLYAKIAKYGL